MDNKTLDMLHSLLSRIPDTGSNEQLDELLKKYSGSIPDVLLQDIREISTRLITLHDISSNELKLSEQEYAELAETNKIIDENLFDYHFQPIINTVDGEIYSYEALMRPRSKLCPSPFHIIRYAEIAGRLNDIESATFLNVLSILEEKKAQFGGRKIYINSFPETVLSDEDFERAMELLRRNLGTVVVEMTEQSQLDDERLAEINDLYRQAGVEIAIDDYGTGYSNVQNLLRYMPEYVKIDRSLISEIHNNKKKRHFVREIIEFCHDNNISALAEGVETAEELRTVILLGIDLVQGYYTSRPSAEIIDAIPYEIRQEIKLYRQEREEGKKLHVYTAGQSERILLDRLVKEDYHCILIGKNGSGDVTIASSPGIDTKIHIDIVKDFRGCITLENASMANSNDRLPCIDIGEDCDVVLNLSGINYLKNGIKVPESSKLTIKGDGQLKISINGLGFYAIGNDEKSRHGELVFETGVTIENNSPVSVCIGSGLGGKINIRRGQFFINMRGHMGVGIGALNADTDLKLYACDITMDNNVEIGAAIGSLTGRCNTDITHTAVKIFLSGSNVVGIGTIDGNENNTSVCEASVIFDIVADHCSAVGALSGKTILDVSKAHMHITSQGDYALAVGGYTSDTELKLSNSDSSINLITKADYKNYVTREHMAVSGGRTRISVNQEEIMI
ncbi:MAG: EAL domain-containing protein [Ruminiclostridium sp.]|nr:EAL domain-containing protein [Ruminiclostridium sp.]